eukprot:1950500-Alexandrium_andersonii.AAC.1
MTRCDAFSLSFHSPGRSFDADRIDQQCPGFLAALRARLRARYASPADALQPFQRLLGDD